MGLGVSIFLLAVGAVLAFAIDVESSGGVNLNTIGLILMAVGVIGVLAFVTVFGSWRSRRGDDVVVEERRTRF